jgi:hypothetical protein
MPDTPPDPGPRTPYLGLYLIALIVALIAMTAFGWLLAVGVGFGLPIGPMAIVPAIVAASFVGRRWGAERGQVPDGPTAWRWSMVAGLVFLALALVLAPPLLSLAPDPLAAVPLAVMVIAGSSAMAVVVHRVFLVAGAKAGVAKAARR